MHCTQKVLSEIAGFDGLDIGKMHSFDNDLEFLLLSEWRNDNQCNFLALGRKLFQECTVQDSVYKYVPDWKACSTYKGRFWESFQFYQAPKLNTRQADVMG